MTQAELDESFRYHAPFGNQPERYSDLRRVAKDYASVVLNCCPDTRERASAITAIRLSLMWANASIAVNEKESA